MLKGGVLAGFVSCNFRMNEFTGAVLCGQLQKLETICKALRTNSAKVRQAIADLPGLKLRKSPDLEGDLGVSVFLDLGTSQRRARYLRAMAAEGVPASPPGGSVILPDQQVDRGQVHHPPRLALVPESRGQGDPLRRRSLPAHHRHHRPLRRRDDGSQVQRRGPPRRRPGHPQGLPGPGPCLIADIAPALPVR